jgi:hypothetical protein
MYNRGLIRVFIMLSKQVKQNYRKSTKIKTALVIINMENTVFDKVNF